MTIQVDFYLLPEDASSFEVVAITAADAVAIDVLYLACHLTEKIYQQQNTVFIYTESLLVAQQLDELLWSFRDDSFVPHQIYEPLAKSAFLETPTPPVLIGYADQATVAIAIEESFSLAMDVLVNLAPVVPPHYRQFSKIVEWVPQQPDAARQLARERYRFYKKEGCIVNYAAK